MGQKKNDKPEKVKKEKKSPEQIAAEKEKREKELAIRNADAARDLARRMVGIKAKLQKKQSRAERKMTEKRLVNGCRETATACHAYRCALRAKRHREDPAWAAKVAAKKAARAKRAQELAAMRAQAEKTAAKAERANKEAGGTQA